MRRQPFRICGIPGKTTAQLVINSAINHFIQGKTGLVQSLLDSGIIIILEKKPD